MIQEPNKTVVLDHGYVTLVEFWGSDEAIIESARMSTDGAFRGWGPLHSRVCQHVSLRGFSKDKEWRCCENAAGDENLLKFLWSNQHTTPFEQCGVTFEIMAPIMVFREWQRHRTQSYNEMSARYIPLSDVNYIPTLERVMVNETKNKQASSAEGSIGLTEKNANLWLVMLEQQYLAAEATYRTGLQLGIPKELARLIIPVGRYSKMRASANLLNWLRFLKLRMAPNAQYEIRECAKAVHAHLSIKFPRTMELYDSSAMA